MSELLIELFCEEIPAMMQSKAEVAYIDIFKKYFTTHDIGFKEVQVFIGPRRIAIHANGVDKQTPAKDVSLKGPKVDAPLAAIDGFCKSNNVDKKDLIIKDVKGVDCYFYETKQEGQKAGIIFEQSLQEPLVGYVWPKSMYWSDYQIKWVRPIQNILCIFDNKVVPFKLGHLTANNFTYGHRFMGRGQIVVTSFASYLQALKENFVILSRQERIEIIKEGMEAKASKLGLKIKDDPVLLEEVAGLVEFPVVMLGSIEQKFLQLPSEILVSSMRTHQKYFSLFDKDGDFAPYFLFASNMNPADHNYIIGGNERVLSARLSDALYFYNQDIKRTLESRVEDLAKVVFHAKLGSIKDKTDRLVKLVRFIDFHHCEQPVTSIPCNEEVIEQAAQICKSDILSESVGEFPELQGIMGYYYALNDGKSKAVATAIRDHYKPQGPSDSCPKGESAILALADKVDSMCGLIIAGFTPTGSKDPYAIRRLAFGIIRIILENKLQINIPKLIEFACGLYEDVIKVNSESVIQIIDFVEERVRNYFKDSFDHEQIKAVLNIRIEPDLLITKEKLDAFAKFLDTNDGKDLLASYKRATNILAGKSWNGLVSVSLFNNKAEELLFETLESSTKNVENLVLEKNFHESLEVLASMKMSIANFFDNVMVMDENPDVANNRLLLLSEVKMIFDRIADFGKL